MAGGPARRITDSISAGSSPAPSKNSGKGVNSVAVQTS